MIWAGYRPDAQLGIEGEEFGHSFSVESSVFLDIGHLGLSAAWQSLAWDSFLQTSVA
jgi:hypothetical protein